MSVEDIQKVNKFAQELLDQGVVETREDAVAKAQEFLNKEIAGNDVQIRETDEKQNIAASADSEERLRNMVERTKTYVESQFAAYKNALLGLERELHALHQQVEELKARGAVKTAADTGFAEKKVEEAAEAGEGKPEDPAKVEEKKESHPRTGNHNSEDVSIEKMFYYGNK